MTNDSPPAPSHVTTEEFMFFALMTNKAAIATPPPSENTEFEKLRHLARPFDGSGAITTPFGSLRSSRRHCNNCYPRLALISHHKKGHIRQEVGFFVRGCNELLTVSVRGVCILLNGL